MLMKEGGASLLLLAVGARKPSLGPGSWFAIHRVSSKISCSLEPHFPHLYHPGDILYPGQKEIQNAQAFRDVAAEVGKEMS